ncbi:FAD:protein FMN transferase [Lysobacter sp.]|uniref:FAD:protein FMN transferase n=1 Tax=Lysobacter sp. TaxID=72226 RepID=UPI002D6EA2D2|nr:FAD:protein FMN transferase [Lysobacter sp.]HZX76137.1 FAD:protein FMN transferase [Lysobacter sp.]
MRRYQRTHPTGLARLLAVLLLVAVIASAMTWMRPVGTVEAEYLVFGTRARIVIRTRDRERAESALASIGALLARDHRTWHAWEPSELTRLNDALAKGRSYAVPPDLLEMIRAAQRGHALSEGLFNPAAGKLIGTWGFHTSDYPAPGRAPSSRQVRYLVARAPSMDDIRIDAEGKVSSGNAAAQLDLNALAEGYAAQQVRDLLQSRGMDDALVYIGGFVLARGQDAGQPWRVGVRGPEGLLGSVEMRDGEALSSSGDYLRRRSDAQGGHIVNPRNGRPQRVSAATTVLSDDPVLADMAATTLMVAGPEGFDRLAARMGLGCALLVATDGRLHITRAMLTRLAEIPARMPRVVHAGAPSSCGDRPAD